MLTIIEQHRQQATGMTTSLEGVYNKYSWAMPPAHQVQDGLVVLVAVLHAQQPAGMGRKRSTG